MHNLKRIKNKALIALALLFFLNSTVFAQEQVVTSYSCELGKIFYHQGKIEDAIAEFKRVLLLDPSNQTAKNYINSIFIRDLNPSTISTSVAKSPTQLLPAIKSLTRDQAMNLALNQTLDQQDSGLLKSELEGRNPQNLYLEYYTFPGVPADEERGIEAGPLKIRGSMQLAFGAAPHDIIWKRANFDLNEKYKSWRVMSDTAFNHRINTYDPRIYDSLDVNLDTQNEEGLNFHTDVTVDPWSFVGKSDKVTLTGSNGDTAEIEMYYWSNTAYTVNNTVYTSLKGDTFSLPEIKVNDGKSYPVTVNPYRNQAATFNIPAMKIHRYFQPVRELWLDYANDQLKLRTFPIAYQDQAYSSDDPLGITNHRIWWQDSLWLRRYVPGNYNSQDTSPSYTKGRWDDSISFLAKDSTGKYLTALRGFAFSFQPQEKTSFDATVATPKHLWQDYNIVDNIIGASRLKHYLTDNFMLGATATSRFGFITEPHQKLDSQNFVGGMDLGYEPIEGLKASAEVLTSSSFYDKSNKNYKTDARGQAYYFSLISRYPRTSIMALKYGYDDIAMDKSEDFLVKSKFYAVRMDKGFDSALSNFHNSRQDTFWSRHLHFRRPFEYYYAGLTKPPTNWDELNASRIGDGIDVGRNVLGFRLEIFLEDRLTNLFDVHNVHNVNGKFVENVARDELAIKLTEKLTAKALGIYQRMPKTSGGIDPFIYDGNTGDFYKNSSVVDEQNSTLKTGSAGLNYDLFDWLSINGIYERTNDYSLAYGDFPRNVLKNDTTLYGTYYQNDKLYRFKDPFLYSQGYFPQAPYAFYNIFKCGLRIAPMEKMELYLDYTRNEFEVSSLNSDNINHMGLELAYMPTPKIGMALKYIYSRCRDLDSLIAGATKPTGHHNFFSEFRYLPTKDDELILQYGEGNTSPIGNITLDPYGGSMLTLDTQHIVRAYYRRKF